MHSNDNYICNTPVVLIIYNRPELTQKTFLAIRKVKPKRFIIISDGPKYNDKSDEINVNNCLSIIEEIDWECDLIIDKSSFNLGCLRRVVTGINFVFTQVEKAIILEDDCLPTIDFFKFIEWGLNTFENEEQIGMISGSNLIANIYNINYLNGYSNYINIWGWGTWKNKWEIHNPFVSNYNIDFNLNKVLSNKKFNFVEKFYWKQLLKYSINLGSTWDFQLQYTFFLNNLISVFPVINLIDNIGFGISGTHTNTKIPAYVYLNKAKNENILANYTPDFSIKVSRCRDLILAKTIWHLNLYSSLKLYFRNIFGYFKRVI